MPELPEVEAIVRKLRRSVRGARISHVNVYRPRASHPQSPAVLAQSIGLQIRCIERWGKNIVLRLDAGRSIRVHLRMTGNLYVIPDARLHTDTVRVLLAFDDGRGLVLDDPRLLGSVNLYTDLEIAAKLEALGVDPTKRQFTPEFLVRAASQSKRPAKLFLMDQYPVAGLGNIYAAESLFRARIDPRKPVNRIRRDRIATLHAAIRDVLKEAIPAAIRSYKEPENHDGMMFYVYDREGQPCRVCGRSIRRIEQGGRSTYFCPVCQRA